MAVDVFRPQSVGRAVRTAFVLGVLLVIAILAGVAAYRQFSSLVGPHTDQLSRYLDSHQHSTVRPSGAGFKIDFPIQAGRESENVVTGRGTVVAKRDAALVDDEIQFQVVWFDLPASAPSGSPGMLTSLVSQQVHQLHGTRIALDAQGRLDRAILRDFVYKNVDSAGTTRYYDERVLLAGRKAWIVRVVSRVRRDDAFRQFAASFTFTS